LNPLTREDRKPRPDRTKNPRRVFGFFVYSCG
jgi:hypothetical protein